MRILYLTGHYPPDLTSGATLQVQRLAHAARAAGHDVRVVAGGYRMGLADGAVRDTDDTGVPVRWIGSTGWTDQDHDANWWNPVASKVVADLLDEWRPDVVHAHALQTLGGGVLQEPCDRGIRTVVTMHDLWWWCARLFLVDRSLRPCALVTCMGECPCARTAEWRQERSDRLRAVLARVDVVLTPSAALRDVVVANGLAPERVRVDPNDVAVERRTAPLDSSALVAAPDVRFLYLGGPNPLKGADVMAGAARHLTGANGWRLSAYGWDAGVADLPERATALAPFDPTERSAVLQEADVLVLPSVARESFSLAAREALAAGLAVITSDCLGPEEVVEHEVNGLVVPTGDATALAGAMRRLVEDRPLLARLRTGALSTPISTLDADAHVAVLLTVYAGREASTDPTGAVPATVFVVGVDGDRARWRAHQGAEALRLLGGESVVVGAHDPLGPSLAARHDVTVLVDVGLDAAIPVVEAATAAGRTVLFDADDLDVVDTAMLRHCHGVLAATDGVARVVGEGIGAPTRVVPVSVGIVDGIVADRLRTASRRPGRVRVGVLGDGPGADAAWRSIEAAVVATLAARMDVELHLVGPLTTDALTDALGDRLVTAPAPAWLDRAAVLHDLDVLMVPVAPPPAPRGDVHAARQWAAAALVGTPVVASDVPAVRSLGRAGRDMLVASSPDDWRIAIEQLLDDDTRRRRMGAAAGRQAVLHHGPHAHARRLAAALRDLTRDRAQPLPVRPVSAPGGAAPAPTALAPYAAPGGAERQGGRIARFLRRQR